jgi:uncharacterized SAM-binding protein YcdF (DUF218 family)
MGRATHPRVVCQRTSGSQRRVFLVLVRRDAHLATTGPLAIVVLGCRVLLGADGRLGGVLAARVEAASRLYAAREARVDVVIASGGRRWGGVVEADAMARELELRGVPPSRVARERCSLTTGDNARFVADALARRGAGRAILVTCDWHMPRALALFGRAGIDAHPYDVVADANPSRRRRLWRWGREAILGRAQGVRPVRGDARVGPG